MKLIKNLRKRDGKLKDIKTAIEQEEVILMLNILRRRR